MEFEEIITHINKNFKKFYISGEGGAPKNYLEVSPKDWKNLAHFLRNDEKLLFDSLMCITGIDYGVESDLIGVAYNLHSMHHLHKFEVRVSVSKSNLAIPSVEQIWRLADWFEREVYDMFGVTFEGHRDLRRILLPEDWEGYPLRKDYQFPETWHGIVVPKIKEEWK